MNIIISPFDSKGFICRPDSTLLRAITEYFLPDYVEGLSLSPVFYIKTHRAGKAISPRFIERYIDGAGYGLLLYPQITSSAAVNQSTLPFVENSLDYTSIIPLSISPFNSHSYSETSPYQLLINGKSPSDRLVLPDKKLIFNKISEISQYCSLRIGDFITFELAPHTPVPVPSGISGNVSGEELFSFSVK